MQRISSGFRARLLFLLTGMLFGTGCHRSELVREGRGPNRQIIESWGFVSTDKPYASCDAIQGAVERQLNRKREGERLARDYYSSRKATQAAAPVDAMSTKDSATVEAGQQKQSSITNTQELNVDEQDFVKITDRHLLILRNYQLEVLDRASLSPKTTIDLSQDFGSSLLAPQQADTPVTHLKMYSFDKTVAIMGSYSEASNIYAPTPKFKVILLREGEDGALVRAAQHQFTGEYLDSRLHAGNLYVVSRDDTIAALPHQDGSSDYRLEFTEGKLSGVPCEQIGQQPIEDMDFRLSKIAKIDLKDVAKQPSLLAVLGSGDQIYMTELNLYLSKSRLMWTPWMAQPEDAGARASLWDTTMISRIQIHPETGDLSFGGSGLIQGTTRNQFHFKEFPEQGVLAVATTSNGSPDMKALGFPGQTVGKGRNHLWILRQREGGMDVVNGLYQYGKPGEDIRAVRFEGQHAYVVTFKKTDPLYAFNLSNPLEPSLEGELFIPGFSLYLHPVAEGRLVGVGFDAAEQGDFALFQGIQVSLFDAADPRQLKRLDHKIHGGRGSYSDVTGNHHAFTFDAATQTFALPLVEFANVSQTNDFNYANALAFSGAVLYRLEGDLLAEQGRISHSDLVPKACQQFLNSARWWQSHVDSIDINRVFKLDDRWLSVSRFGLKRHDPAAAFKTMQATSFDAAGSQCAENMYGRYLHPTRAD